MRNKTNVTYVDIKYYSMNNTVRCDLTYEININKWPIFGFTIDSDILCNVAEKLGAKYIVTDKKTNYPFAFGFKVTAKATCDMEQDEYDETKGKQIALTRAQAKAFEKTCKFYDFIQIELDKSFSEITRIIDNCWHASNKCWDHAKELGNY